ncbi:sigma-70 family RNA polymerase sigma factor [Streptomyces sp. MUM 203J]|uniref:sigma-70 family RNA polymerase sigma factor n=1 Tax=Streptomyces sp. MUM 203J TaxID=2791990 RepID=UPI001F0437C4|nr:sigma-70 family RNA polymerase sigma factor [Streptomyces sp. MUM 203J]MCH0539705.1 sigma-70 family RNA polymerase sigma factor [Streptomyces sp. MUM 203J]
MQRDDEHDPELVRAARAGDRRARERLVADYLPLVYNIVGRALDGHADVDDVVQDTMFRALDGLGGLREPSRFRPWLVAIAMNQIRRRWTDRRQAPVATLERLAERPDPGADFVDLTILRLGLSGQRREVAEATRWLDEEDRELLALWWQEAAGELSRAELAEALDVPARHAAVRVQRMKERLETGRMVVRALAAAPRCPELARLTEGWDGRPAGVWRKRVARHARGCRGCGGHGSGLVPAEGLLAGLALVPPAATCLLLPPPGDGFTALNAAETWNATPAPQGEAEAEPFGADGAWPHGTETTAHQDYGAGWPDAAGPTAHTGGAEGAWGVGSGTPGPGGTDWATGPGTAGTPGTGASGTDGTWAAGPGTDATGLQGFGAAGAEVPGAGSSGVSVPGLPRPGGGAGQGDPGAGGGIGLGGGSGGSPGWVRWAGGAVVGAAVVVALWPGADDRSVPGPPVPAGPQAPSPVVTASPEAVMSSSDVSPSPEAVPSSPAPEPSRSPSPSPSPTATRRATAAPGVEQRLTELVNARRAEAGCGPLRLDPRLTAAARAHAQDMLARGYFDHASPEGQHADARMEAAGYDAGAWAENLHQGPQDAAVVVDDWMDGAGHQDNMLGCGYRDTGVAAVPGPRGTVWVQTLAAPAG